MSNYPPPEEILKRGSIEVRVLNQGMQKRYMLKVELEHTPFGKVSFLVSKQPLSSVELVRLAGELKLPIKYQSTRVFPPGKMMKDFVVQ
jgi:hypothetical protein